MKISVIIPVYNVEQYLERCLTSIANQTYPSLEVIIVNDGSKDQSQTIIDQFVMKYPFMKSYQKPNGGLSDARNFGIQKATGEYLSFIDSDDYVDVTMYEKLAKKANEKAYDLVVCDFYEVYPSNTKVCSSNINEDVHTDHQLRCAMHTIYPSAWNKLYKKQLFSHIEFKKGVWFEDVEFCYRMFPHIHTIGVVKEPLYYYIQREGSISKSSDPRIYHTLENWEGIIAYYKHIGAYSSFEKELEYSFVRYIYATFVKSATKLPYQEFKVAIKKAKALVQQYFPKYRRNVYFYRSLKGIYLMFFCLFFAKIIYYKQNQHF